MSLATIYSRSRKLPILSVEHILELDNPYGATTSGYLIKAVYVSSQTLRYATLV